MTCIRRIIGAILFCFFLVVMHGFAQNVPLSASRPWQSSRESQYTQTLKTLPEPVYSIAGDKVNTLAELIDLAEQHNPETNVAWQGAKSRAAALGIAESARYPVITAVALAATTRMGVLIGSGFHLQNVGLFQPTVNLDYLIFDFGGRAGAIDVAKANLFEANFSFNDTHLKIIYQVTAGYYRLLNAMGQQDAAKASLENAQAVQQNAEERLAHGLATAPDVLEAKAQRAQAEYDLQAALGARMIAQGELSTVLGLRPGVALNVQGLDALATPAALAESADKAIDRAFEQRPDLMQQVTRIRAADGALEQARSAYLPTLSFSGRDGWVHAYGQQDNFPGAYASGKTWAASLSLTWTIFDGGKRESEVAQAKADRARAQAGINALRDQIANEVWAAYTNAETALRQQQAATALLEASEQSYSSALEAYKYGVRSLLDVVSAQRTLAQARSANISARTQVLTQIANLAFRTGDLLHAQSAKPQP